MLSALWGGDSPLTTSPTDLGSANASSMNSGGARCSMFPRGNSGRYATILCNFQFAPASVILRPVPRRGGKEIAASVGKTEKPPFVSWTEDGLGWQAKGRFLEGVRGVRDRSVAGLRVVLETAAGMRGKFPPPPVRFPAIRNGVRGRGEVVLWS